MKIKAILDTRKPNNRGECSIKISIHHQNKTHLFTLSIFIVPSQWDKEFQKVINHKLAPSYNRIIENSINRIKVEILNLRASGKPIAEDDIKKIVRGDEFEDKTDERKEEKLFKEVFIEYNKTMANKRTKSSQNSSLTIIQDYHPNLLLKDMDKNFLEKFIKQKQNKFSANYLRQLFVVYRAVYNFAINKGYANINDYPFRGLKLPRRTVAHRALTIEQLRELRDMNLDDTLSFARDWFMLSFYLCGMNLPDISHLDEEMIKSGEIVTYRRKTKQPIRMMIQIEAKVIFEKYKDKLLIGDKAYSFDSLRIKLQTIAKQSKTLPHNLTPYFARHSWATIASFLDIPEKTIGNALAHANTTITSGYINFDHKKVDEANRKVIDYLNDK